MSALRPLFRSARPLFYRASSTASPAAGESISTAPGGTPLTNINYFKNKPDPVALDDTEYPSWLWGALESGKSSAGSAEESGDLYSKSKKARALAKKAAAKRAALDALNPEKHVPIEEQTIDLPFATQADGIASPLKRTVATVEGVFPLSVEGKKAIPSTVEISADGVNVTIEQALAAQRLLKKALRRKGRAKIKEANFLAQM